MKESKELLNRLNELIPIPDKYAASHCITYKKGVMTLYLYLRRNNTSHSAFHIKEQDMSKPGREYADEIYRNLIKDGIIKK